MPSIYQEIKDLERKDWQLWALTITILLVFGIFILLTFFYSDLQGLYEKEISHFNYNLLFLGFTALSLLLVAYILLKERSIKALRRDLINQKMLTYNLENHFQELKALFEVSTLVNSEAELPNILKMICKTVLKSVEGETLFLWLYDKKKDKLICSAAYSKVNKRIDSSEATIDPKITSWIMENGKPLLLEKEKRVLSLGSGERSTGSNLFVPLKVKKEVKGILNVTSQKHRKRFDHVDLKLVSIFAENVTASLEKAEVCQELKFQAEALEKTIKDLRTTQNQLVQSEKLRALGDVASGVAHDFNNILAVILGRTELLLKEVEKEGPKRCLKVIEQVANDGAQIIRRLQEFTRTGGEEAPMEVDANRIIRQVVDIARHRWKNEAEARGIKIDVLTELEKLPPLKIDPSELREVLINMIINAVDALPKGGRIILKSWEKAGFVYVSVEDTGIGINQQEQKRVFDPFFSTKGVKGIGLGLSVAYGIITRYGGEIAVESELNKGSTFVIKIPLQKSRKVDSLEKNQVLPLQPEGFPITEERQAKVVTYNSDLSQSHDERG